MTVQHSESNGVYGYIHDGYTRRGYIAEVRLLHEALRFTYRPMLQQDRSVVMGAITQTKDLRKAESISAEIIKSQLAEWDLHDHESSAVPLEVPNILRIQPSLFDRLLRIVLGGDGGDEDPDAGGSEQAEDAGQQLAAALAGTTPEELTEKNSGKG